MMTETHPDDVELLDFVEDDLSDERKPVVSGHVEACSACGEKVRRLQTARDALHDSRLLQLPERSREAIVAALPQREPRRPRFSVKRLVVVLTPVAAIAAVAVVLTTTDVQLGGGGENGEAVPAEAGRAAETAPAAEAPALRGDATQAPVRSVAGPPGEVVDFLREKGLRARAVDGEVHVEGARLNEVQRALAARPDGDVPVFVTP